MTESIGALAPPGGGRCAVPGDLSAAAYPLAAAAIVPGSEVEHVFRDIELPRDQLHLVDHAGAPRPAGLE